MPIPCPAYCILIGVPSAATVIFSIVLAPVVFDMRYIHSHLELIARACFDTCSTLVICGEKPPVSHAPTRNLLVKRKKFGRVFDTAPARSVKQFESQISEMLEVD